MKIPVLFKEYIWLVNTIYQAGKISFAKINEKWLRTEMSGGVEIARTTFNRHKDAIEDIFGIIIDCDKKMGSSIISPTNLCFAKIQSRTGCSRR